VVVFLIGNNSHYKGSISLYAIPLALTDFFQQYMEENQKFTRGDYIELRKIRTNPAELINSYLFQKIEPFLLPFYVRNNHS